MPRTFSLDVSRALAFMSLLLFCGCFAKNPAYPETWPKLGAAESVTKRILGTYSCQGEIVQNDLQVDPLYAVTGFLIGGSNPGSCDALEIQKIGPDDLLLRLVQTGGSVRELVYKNGEDYRVDGDWIILKGSYQLTGDLGVGQFSTTPHLTTDCEGDLIVKLKTYEGALVLFVIPAGSSGTQWGKFKRIN